jgi:hypothetical protein
VIGQRLVMRYQKNAEGKPPTPLLVERVSRDTGVAVSQDVGCKEGPSFPQAWHGDSNEHGTAQETGTGMAAPVSDIPCQLRLLLE